MAGVPFQKYFQLLSKYMGPFKRHVTLLAGFMLLNIVLRIVNPQVIRFYIDSVIDDEPLQVLAYAAILYIIFAIISQALTIFNVYLSQSVSWGSTNLLRSDILSHTMSLDMTFHNQYKPGEMIERVDGDVNALSNFFSQLVLQLVTNILLIVGILVALFFEGWLIGLVFTGFTIFGLVATFLARKLAVPHWKKTRESFMNLFGYIEERISGTEDIRALGAVPNAMKKLYVYEEDRYRKMMKAITISRLISVVFTGLIGFGITLVFLVGIPLFERGSITIGTIFLMNYYVTQLVGPIFAILRQIQTLQQADASIERIEELFDMKSAIKNEGTHRLDSVSSISFDSVNFEYFEGKPVLQDISFDLKEGEKLGLIGRTGSGKTTISRLLYRLYDIQDGSIRINDIPIRDYELYSLRAGIGLVTQDVQLFNTTLRNNMTFFNHDIEDERLIEIIQFLNLGEWFVQLEKGLDTNITHDDVSAGQAQLIALSRIFLSDPHIIILDEASSRLDPATETIMSQALERLTRDKTTIIIAHRLSTLETTDKILELHFGKILEYGDRKELVANPESNYSRLLKTGKEVLFA